MTYFVTDLSAKKMNVQVHCTDCKNAALRQTFRRVFVKCVVHSRNFAEWEHG